jgi:hypothetical protein
MKKDENPAMLNMFLFIDRNTKKDDKKVMMTFDIYQDNSTEINTKIPK